MFRNRLRCIKYFSVHIVVDNNGSKQNLLPSFTDILTALKCYRQNYGHLVVPNKYVIYSAPDVLHKFPSNLEGYPLGLHVVTLRKNYRIKNKELTQFEIEQLRSIDFVFNVKEFKFNELVKCLELYRLHSNQNDSIYEIAKDFTIPSKTPWPIIFWSKKVLYIFRFKGMVDEASSCR